MSFAPGASNGVAVQLAARSGRMGPIANAPLHIFAPIVGVVGGAIKGLIP